MWMWKSKQNERKRIFGNKEEEEEEEEEEEQQQQQQQQQHPKVLWILTRTHIQTRAGLKINCQ